MDMKLSTLPDIFRRWSTTEIQMTATETGSGNNYIERNELATRFQRLPLHLATMLDKSLTLSTLPDVDLITGIQDGEQ